jgi:hypothetical protein
VDAAPTGDGGLRVTLGATTAPGTPTNHLLRLLGGLGTNVGAVSGDFGIQTVPFDVTMPANTGQVSFTLRRAAPDQATTLQLIVEDGCGQWPTFVGGGPGAF